MARLLRATIVAALAGGAAAAVSWTPIYPASNNQIDLWTLTDTGCSCPWDRSRKTCACCSVDGGCPCGKTAPSRCAQCGLQQHCTNMCNITLDSQYLDSSSGKTYGQIKTSVTAGPLYCWYLFRAAPGTETRIEVQVYRMVRSGRWREGCNGRGLTFRPGLRLGAVSETSREVCGQNSRFSPPVTMLLDSTDAVLEYRVPEKTERSLFMAFFSFSPRNSPHVGMASRGGRPVPHTECDWMYRDLDCMEKGRCVITSPGYPGIYPPNTRCKYFIFINKVTVAASITFTVMDLPKQLCASHYITVYAGSTVASPKLATLCGGNTTSVEYRGPKLLVEFSSGSSVPPFSYNGFLAVLEFRDVSALLMSAHQQQLRTPGVPGETSVEEPSLLLNEAPSGGDSGCALLLSGHRQRSGFFSSSAACNITFQGRPSDVVVLSLLNYRLGGGQCKGMLEVVHGDPTASDNATVGGSSFKLCSPVYRTVRTPQGRVVMAEKIWSSTNKVFIRFQPRARAGNSDYMEGAYLFHNEASEGHLTAGGRLCHAETDAEVSARSGRVSLPEGVPLLWDFEGSLGCRHTFRTRRHSFRLEVTSSDQPRTSLHCVTSCVDNRCRCLVDLAELHDVDHLQLLTTDGRQIACLCGNFTDALPLTLYTNRDVVAEYNMAHFMWSAVGPNFTIGYSIGADFCPPAAALGAAGGTALTWPLLPNVTSVSHVYNYVECYWRFNMVTGMSQKVVLDASTGVGAAASCRQLNVSVTSLGRGPHALDALVDVYCLGQGRRTVPLAAASDHSVRLTHLGPAAITFRLEWKLENRSATATAPPSTVNAGAVLLWAALLSLVGIT